MVPEAKIAESVHGVPWVISFPLTTESLEPSRKQQLLRLPQPLDSVWYPRAVETLASQLVLASVNSLLLHWRKMCGALLLDVVILGRAMAAQVCFKPSEHD